MNREAIAGIEKIINSDRIRKQHVRILAGMPDATPGLTCFRVRISKRNVFDFEASTAELTIQPQSVEKKLPETTDPVNVTWINRNPEPYYESIKNKPFTGTAHYYEGKWWWDSPVCQDYLNEYGRSPCDEIHPDIEITAWQSLPEPYKAQEEE